MTQSRGLRPARGAPPAAIALRNSLLAALLATEYRRLLPRLEHVTLKRGAIVYRADHEIEHVYFPEEAVVAMVDTTHDGRTSAGALVGELAPHLQGTPPRATSRCFSST